MKYLLITIVLMTFGVQAKSTQQARNLLDMINSPLRVYLDRLDATPIDDILQYDRSAYSATNLKYRHILNRYRRYYIEATELHNYCQEPRDIYFSSMTVENEFQRSVIASLQYIGLQKTIPAIVEYMRKLEYTEAESETTIENLVGNYCSRNLSVMSLKRLRQNFFEVLHSSKHYPIPTIKGNPFFPAELDTINSNEKIYQHELYYTIELFKSFCSWSGDPKNVQLLAPLLRNEVVFSYLIRQLIAKKFAWQEDKKEIVRIDDPDSVQVYCDNFICRKMSMVDFSKLIPKSIGGEKLELDLKKSYCTYFSTVNPPEHLQDKRLQRLLSDRTHFDDSFLVAQFIALITGIPDLLMRGNLFKDIFSYMDISIDSHFDKWADRQIKYMNSYLYYEDSIKVKKMARNFYFQYNIPKFAVHFDVSLGEWDRTVYNTGKVKMSFDLHMPYKLARWVVLTYKFIKSGDVDKVLEVEKRVTKQVERVRLEAQQKLRYPLWTDKIDTIIAQEIIDQFIYYKGRFFNSNDEKDIHIPVVFHIGPFALKYLNYRLKVDKDQKALMLSNTNSVK